MAVEGPGGLDDEDAGIMGKPTSVAGLTELGRVRLSEHLFMRDMLSSEVGNFHGIPNILEDPDLASAPASGCAGSSSNRCTAP